MRKLTNLYILTFIYLILSFIGILNHEIWLDEAHHWLLAKESSSIADLIENSKYEGHPILWNVLLYLISRLTPSPFWMQFFHVIISTTVVFVFLKKAPFKSIFKILFIFGYFILFEYNLLSRNYMLGILFIFLACSLYKHKKDQFIYFTILLAIASNTHAIFLIITCSIMFIEFYEFIEHKKFKFNKKYTIGWSIFILGIIISIIQIIPPSDNAYFPRITEIPLSEKFTHGIFSLFKGLINIPDFTSGNLWNSNLFINVNKPLAGILIIFTYLLPLFLFYKNKILLNYVYFGILLANAFFYVTQLSSLRYDGALYILIISGLWISKSYDFKPNKLNLILPSKKLTKIKEFSIYTILIIQFISGITFYVLDLMLPFDNSKKVATYITKNNLLNNEIMDVSCKGLSVSAYLNKKRFSLCTNDYESYCKWQKNCGINGTKLEELFSNFIKLNNKNITFISNYPLDEKKGINHPYKLLKKFKGSILKSNDYYIYEISNY